MPNLFGQGCIGHWRVIGQGSQHPNKAVKISTLRDFRPDFQILSITRTTYRRQNGSADDEVAAN